MFKRYVSDKNNVTKITEIKTPQDQEVYTQDLKLIISLENKFKKYLTLNPMDRDWDRVKDLSWEKFELIKNDDDTVSFKGAFSMYLSFNPSDNSLTWNKSSISSNEKFSFKRYNEFYTIQNKNNKYLKVRSDNSMTWVNEIDDLCEFKLYNKSFKFERIKNLVDEFEYLKRSIIELEEKLNRQRREQEAARAREERRRRRRYFYGFY